MEKTPEASAHDTLTGLFADEVELIDQITEWTMQARENESLRRSVIFNIYKTHWRDYLSLC